MTILRDLFGPGTWGAGGNLVAWVICGVLAMAGGWLLRNRIGPALGRWLHTHHTAAVAEDLKGHIEDLLAGHLADVDTKLAAHCADVKEHVTAMARPAAARRKPGGAA